MVAEFAKRRQELLDECKVAPQVFDRVMARLETFMNPFVDVFARKEQVSHVRTMVQGLLSDIGQKNTESIALRFGQQSKSLQMFMGVSDWNDEPLRDELALFRTFADIEPSTENIGSYLPVRDIASTDRAARSLAASERCPTRKARPVPTRPEFQRYGRTSWHRRR